MDKREAIKYCKQMWEEIYNKSRFWEEEDWERTEIMKQRAFKELGMDGYGWMYGCPLCEVAGIESDDFTVSVENCSRCALVEQLGKTCLSLGYYDYIDKRQIEKFYNQVRRLKVKGQCPNKREKDKEGTYKKGDSETPKED